MRRIPIRSETDAFRLAAATAGLALAGGMVGWLTTPVAGVCVFVGLACGGLAVYMSAPDGGPGGDLHRPLRAAAHEHHRHGVSRRRHGAAPRRRRVIIVANETLAGERLGAYVRGLDGGCVEVDVLAPVLTSRTHLAYTDIDEELREARERLARSLAWARKQGLAARGGVGDASPITALEDELRGFGADEVIVATAEAAPERWQERVELERLREELDVPVVHIAMH